jgi:DNA modification methylase
MELSIELIQMNGGTQPRAAMEQNTVDEYAAEMREGVTFPPVTVYFDGQVYWLADGFHRVHAALEIGRRVIEAEVRQGTRREAVLHSVGANAAHGLRRLNADKRRAVETLLRDVEWVAWSDREIARRCEVGAPFVGNLRKELGLSVIGLQIDGQQRTVARGGKTFQMAVEGIQAAAQQRAAGNEHQMTGAGTDGHTAVGQLADEVGRWAWEKFGEQHQGGILRGLREYRWKHGQWNALLAVLTQPYRMGDVVTAIGMAVDRQRGGGAEGPLRGGGGAATRGRRGGGAEGRCGVCGRPLSDPAHVAQGVGPVCGGRSAEGRRGRYAGAEGPLRGSGGVAFAATVPVLDATATAAGREDGGRWRVAGVAGAGVVEVVQGDCRAVAWGEPGGAQLVVTSPPYNVGIGYASHDDALPEEAYWGLLRAAAAQCYGALCDGGRVCFVVPRGVGRNPWTPFAPRVMDVLVAAGFSLRGSIIWDKATTGNRTSWGSFRLPSDPSLRDTTEEIVVAHKGSSRLELPVNVVLHDDKGPHTGWLADAGEFMALAQDHWSIAPESASRTGHPAPFPVALAERLIRFFGYPGCHVVDPFAGSGTVGVAALRLGCRATLIELDGGYCELAVRRCREETGRQGNQETRGGGDG